MVEGGTWPVGTGPVNRLPTTARRIHADPVPLAQRSVAQPVVSDQVLRRLEAGASIAFPRRDRWCGSDPRHEGRGCENTLGSMPYRAFGEGGRSSHDTCRRCATAHSAAVARDVAAPAEVAGDRCESPEEKSVNRPPTSFSHSGPA